MQETLPVKDTPLALTTKDTPLAPGLYLVATPIGNLEDMSFRALRVLKGASRILCEDTRVSRVLLQHYGVGTKPVPFHEHNEGAMQGKVLDWLRAGEVVALISDAGTPLIADPGFTLVRAVRAEGLMVTAVPGASSLLMGVSLSGLPTDRFAFFGFVPSKAGARLRWLEELRRWTGTAVCFETPHRIGASLAAMAEVLGDRPAVLLRELTKRFEEARAGTLAELAAGCEVDPPRGEMVVVIGPAAEAGLGEMDLDAALAAAMAMQPLKGAVAEVSAALGLARGDVYKRALELKAKG